MGGEDEHAPTGNALRRSLSDPATLLMPTVWDAGTARVARDAGFPVIGTSSAAIATMLGGADAEGVGPEEMVGWADRIVHAAAPAAVNVDLERGYGLSAAELTDVVRTVGCAGINLEDSQHADGHLVDTDVHARRIGALAAGLARLPGRPVLTARVDPLLEVIHREGLGDSPRADAAVTESVERAQACLHAGADVVFPIGLHTLRQLRAFLTHVPPARTALLVPLTDHRLGVVRGLGVSRISFGATPREASDAYLRRALDGLTVRAGPVRRLVGVTSRGVGALLRP